MLFFKYCYEVINIARVKIFISIFQMILIGIHLILTMLLNCVENRKISGILRGPGGVSPNKYTIVRNGTDNASYQETALELSKNMTQMLQNLLRHYNNNQRPGHGGSPTVVTTNILIRSMGPISEQDMAYSMDCYFRQKWVDQRLQFEGQMEQLSLNIKMLELLWKPDTYFHNGKDSYLHTITRPNKLLRILKNGEILYSMRLTIKAKCPMRLENFPMDIQNCPLVFGSYGYPVDEMLYQWDPVGGVSLNEGQFMSQFDLIGFPFRNTTVSFRRGYFSALQVNFRLRRHTGYFLIQVYVPCILIVVLSWVSFWINREATADRVGLGITTVLTLSTFVLDTRTDLPKVSYPTALDWFVIMSFMFVISTLLEFAGVHYFTKIGSGEFPVPIHRVHRRRHRDDSLKENRTTTDDSEDFDDDEDEEWSYEDTPTRSVGESCTDDDKPIQFQSKPKTDLWGTLCCTGGNQVSCSGNNPYLDSARVMIRRGNDTCYPANMTTGTRGVRSPGQRVRARKRRSRAYCCVQFVHCIAGNDKFREEMRKRGSNAPGAINSVSKIDEFSRIFFPLIFIMLNLFYWFFYWRTPELVNFPEY